MEGVLRHESIPLAARDAQGVIHGVLPLVRVRGVLGHYLISLPFMNDGGPIGREDACEVLAAHALELARTSGAGLLELRSRRAVPGALQTSFRKVAVHLALPESVEALWATTFKAKLRSQIRRPAKDGMTAKVGADQLSAFYRVFARNMRDLGTPVLPRSFFETLQSTFGDRVMFTAVFTADGTVAAASCCLQWREEIEVTWASSLREFNKLSPNMLLYATMMEHAIGRGVRVFNFGRSTPGAATHRFKQQWGGVDIPLPWAFWSKVEDSGTPSADGAGLRLAQTMWKRMPLFVANRLGPVLARQLP
jgi:serine/alanine adding enzyme